MAWWFKFELHSFLCLTECWLLLLNWRLIKCFTARYHIAINNNDKQGRKTFTTISHYWYSKASYLNPQIDCLYHHLGIISNPFSLQQLSNYARLLTCIIPSEMAKESMIITLFNLIKELITCCALSFKTMIIKAHILQVLHWFINEFQEVVQKVLNGSLQNYVKKIESGFKKQEVYLATASIAALFEYGLTKPDGVPRLILWQALCEEIFSCKTSYDDGCIRFDKAFNSMFSCQHLMQVLPCSCLSINDLSNEELAASASTISEAALLWSACLSTALWSGLDENYYPFLHVNFVFLWSLAGVEKGMSYIKPHVPWEDVCFFLNKLVKTMPVNVWAEDFPQPDEGAGGPLPEDFALWGQMYTWWYFPEEWFLNTSVDDEERVIKLSSMTKSCLECLVWLGAWIADVSELMLYLPCLTKFT